ncbi:ATP-binding response regulator [Silvimonas amylolytica]|uniref:histidine kinase n=1 Tax=Silvimonas amylolytica TaxID=449663 RepID=A0ABQ2PRH2_9NEIS|nr:hybrid sensor histidine kinase/response regulator [Silvimonas amylolytica]GGP28204.1 hypothetical protein GCM10010971_40230 [Silvimonas amylolytica]
MRKFGELVVLVVDDFEPMRKATLTQLRSMGIERVVQAKDGAEALRILKRQTVDMILSDWNMPIMTGLDFLIAVRKDEALSHLPFVMVTAETERKRIEEAIYAGVSDFLVKPFTPERLESRIEKALDWVPRALQPKPAEKQSVPKLALEQKVELGKPTLLVVDDTPDNMELLSQLFKDEYRVRVAPSGEKALEICHSDAPPDLVLLDVMMPDMDGFEVARQMREHPVSEVIPVIFVTAMTQDDARLTGLELGAIDFVTKPINPEQLTLRVRNFMRYVELRRDLQANYDAMLESARLREEVEHMTRHDMKGPISGVISLTQGLMSAEGLNAQQKDILGSVEESALQLLSMINLTSEIYKIETDRFVLNPAPIDISSVLRRVVEMYRAVFKEKQLTLSVDTDMPVGEMAPRALGDEMFCYSVFQNLIKNACEAAPVKSRVTVELSPEDPLRISITNLGVIPQTIRHTFFEKFTTFGKQGGSGLGTYSARLLTEAQHGRIDFEVSDIDGTTTINVYLLPAKVK